MFYGHIAVCLHGCVATSISVTRGRYKVSGSDMVTQLCDPKTTLQLMNTSKAYRAVVHVCKLGHTLQIVCGHVAVYQCS